MLDGTSNVRDFIPIIFLEGGLVSHPKRRRKGRREGKGKVGGEYFRGERRRFLKRAEEIASLFALYIFNFLII